MRIRKQNRYSYKHTKQITRSNVGKEDKEPTLTPSSTSDTSNKVDDEDRALEILLHTHV